MQKSTEPFKKERQQTDDSLTQERGKADESLQEGRADLQSSTDQIVSTNRDAADQDKILRRNTADQKINSAQSHHEALVTQRQSEDKALEIERSKMDAALEIERGEKDKLMDKVLNEREKTNKHLSDERRKTDTEVKQSANLLSEEAAAHAKTKSALNTREEFLAIVSHDLRNPIGAILSATELLLDSHLAIEVNDATKKLIDLIRRNATSSLGLVSDILDMERIIEGKLKLERAKNRIDDLINHSVESFGHSASAKKIFLKAVPTNSSTEFSFDKQRVEQILSNLIGNALKFTPANGTITVEAQESKNEVTVSVSDTGRGIPEDQKTRIFERFTQSGNKQSAGLGLGLFISRTLVESHGGKLWVTSKEGSGSTFWFTLPISRTDH